MISGSSTAAEPLEACGAQSTAELLIQLRCADGAQPVASLREAARAVRGQVPKAGRCANSVIKYELACEDGEHLLYVDPRMCTWDEAAALAARLVPVVEEHFQVSVPVAWALAPRTWGAIMRDNENSAIVLVRADGVDPSFVSAMVGAERELGISQVLTKESATGQRVQTPSGAFTVVSHQHRPGLAVLLLAKEGSLALDALRDKLPAMREADIQAGKIDILVVYKVDRLSRSLLDFAKVMDRFNQAGTAFVSVTQNFSTADAMGRLTLNMLMSFAEFEREMIAERTRDKIAASRRRGKWTGGTVPIGYKAIDKKLIIDEVEAPIVREIFDLYEQHRSALAVAKLLNKNGRRTKRHRAQNKKVKESNPWTKDAVLRVLKNSVYAGLMPYGEERHEGEHEGIIDRGRFQHAQVMLKDHQGRSLRLGRNPEYILRGVIRCKICGRAMTPASTRKKGREYRYYRCVTRDKKGKDACAARPLSAEAIEEFVVDKIRDATSDGTFAADVTKQLADRVEIRHKLLIKERKDTPREIAKLKSEGKKLAESMADEEGAARRLIDERIAEIERQLVTHEVRLAEIQQMLGELEAREVEGRWVTDTLAHFDKVWEALNVLNQARLVRAIVEDVLIHEQKGTIDVVLADLDIGEDEDDVPAEKPHSAPPASHEPAAMEAQV